MFWDAVMEKCHCLFVRKEARENLPLTICCSRFWFKKTGRQRSARNRASDEGWCRESHNSGVQYGARDNTQKCVITVYLTCMDFTHCIWLFCVPFFVAGPVMVARIRHSPEISYHGCSASSGSERYVAKARHRNKDQWDGLKKLLNEAGASLSPQDS